MVIDISDLSYGHQVLAAHEWIKNVSWTELVVSIQLTGQNVNVAPRHDQRLL